ncbi:hypothetical protein [Roseibium sp. SCP14]|uniref:hypothetical protein n=1 Tax=Roseibium sp. SCP14 TaxID=3141375 RepID=UPI0033383634
MTGQDEKKGGISSFSIGLGSDTPMAAPITPPPPFRVLIAGDFGLASQQSAVNVTGLDVAEILEANRIAFSVRAANGLGSHPSELEEEFTFASLKDLRPAVISENFRFARDLEAAGQDPGRLAEHGQRYDLVLKNLQSSSTLEKRAGSHDETRAGTAQSTGETPTDGGEADGLDALFSMVDLPTRTETQTDNSNLAKAAVDAFVQKTMRGEKQAPDKDGPSKNTSPASKLADLQSRTFFAAPKLRTVLENWHSLKLLLTELPASLPLELHLLQLDHDLSAEDLADRIGGADGALLDELYDAALFANRTGVCGRDAEIVKVIARACADADTVAFLALDPDFSGVAGEQLASMEAPHQLLEEPGYESFQGLLETEAASHIALFWNDARLSSKKSAHPAIFSPGVWIALARVLAQLEREVFPHLPVGVPADFDALEVEESLSRGRAVATAARYLAGPGIAPSLAQSGINVLEGVANRTSLVFRRGVTARPGKEGRGSLDQALLVSRLFSLFQEALGGALPPNQTAEERVVAVDANLDKMSASLGGQVRFQVQRKEIEDQDLISVTASIMEGWASGQAHSFYLPAAGG